MPPMMLSEMAPVGLEQELQTPENIDSKPFGGNAGGNIQNELKILENIWPHLTATLRHRCLKWLQSHIYRRQ